MAYPLSPPSLTPPVIPLSLSLSLSLSLLPACPPVALRWSIQRGVSVVTSTVKAGYLAEDLAVLRGPLLSGIELDALSALKAAVPGVRIVDDWPDVMMPMVALGIRGVVDTGGVVDIGGVVNTVSRGGSARENKGGYSQGGGGEDGGADRIDDVLNDMVMWAKAGGRHVDVASGRTMETAAAEGLRLIMREDATGSATGVASRKELFVTARIPGPVGFMRTMQWANSTALLQTEASASELEEEEGGEKRYLDLILLDGPCLNTSSGGSGGSEDGANGQNSPPYEVAPCTETIERVAAVRDTWKALVELR